MAKGILFNRVFMLNGHSFGDCAYRIAFFVVNGLNIFEELVFIPFGFRNINEVRTAIFRKQVHGGCKPTRISSHDFNENYLALFIGFGIFHDHLGRIDDVKGSRRVAQGVIGDLEIVIDGLWDSNDLNIHFLFFKETGKTKARIHRIVPAIHKNVADIVLLDGGNDFAKKRIVIRGKFLAGRA